MIEPDPNLIVSELSGIVTVNGIAVEVEIDRIDEETLWVLEVVNENGTSTVWNDPFETDVQAFAAFRQAFEVEGIETFLDTGDAATRH